MRFVLEPSGPVRESALLTLPGREAASRERERIERRRVKLVDSGLLAVLAQSAALAFAAATWGEPDRAIMVAVTGPAGATGLALMLAARGGLAASRWYGPVLVAFTVEHVITVAVAALVAGGAASPPALGFVCIVVFVTISSSLRNSWMFGAFIAAAFLAVAALGGSTPPGYVPAYLAAMLIIASCAAGRRG